MEVLLSSETLTNIRFPNLGIELKNLPTGINIFGFNVAFYGILIGLGMLCGLLITERMVKKTGQDMELYLDFALCHYAISQIGLCVIFLDEFKTIPRNI